MAENHHPEDEPLDFAAVLADEREFLKLAGKSSADPSTQGAAKVHCGAFPPAGTGLAFSGGGIRSATFSLGVLQALATKGKLERFDYLSTVSGGGYVGAWLSAWIHRSGISKVVQELSCNPGTAQIEPAPVQWLRRYSNYLTPRIGALSMDALTVGVTWARNVLLNLIILVAAIGALLLLPMLSLGPFAWLVSHAMLAVVIAWVLATIALATMVVNLTLDYFDDVPAATDARPKKFRGIWLLRPRCVLLLGILPGFLSCAMATCWIFTTTLGTSALCAYLGIAFVALVPIPLLARSIAGKINWNNWRQVEHRDPLKTSSRAWFIYIMAAVIAGLAGAGLLVIARMALGGFPINPAAFALARLVPLVTIGPPLVMACCGIGLCLWIGLVGRAFAEPSREWLSRGGAALLLASALWLIWFGLAFYVPFYVDEFLAGTHPWLKSLGSASWLGSLIGTTLLAQFHSDNKQRSAGPWSSIAISLMAAITAIGLFVAIACGLQWALAFASTPPLPYMPVFLQWLGACISPSSAWVSTGAHELYWARYDIWTALDGPWLKHTLIAAFGVLLAVAILFAWRVDINRFSLHNMYKNRLIRAYLGATNADRQPQPFTGFDDADDVALCELGGQRPLHVIGAALNLVQGSNLAWQQRMAASFVFTPRHCGFELAQSQGNRTVGHDNRGYRHTAQYAAQDKDGNQRGFTLGMAVATSGAAVSPNMGMQSKPAFAVLTTFLDIRLGRWSANPARKKYQRASPSFGLFCLFNELCGNTNEESDYVYLSDGGHFENTGVYELIRRKCRRILVIDAGADPQRSFEDLGNLLRKCRIDFGIEIDLDLNNLFQGAESPRSSQGFQPGTIYYAGRQASPQDQGEILLIKPSLCVGNKEPPDIFSYAAQQSEFPQQTTLDQWFDEAQFESYRKLGFDLTQKALRAHPEFV